MDNLNLDNPELENEFLKLLEEIKNFKPDGENDVLDELKNNLDLTCTILKISWRMV